MLRGFAAIRRAVLKRCFAAFLVVAAVGTVLGTSGDSPELTAVCQPRHGS